MHRTTGRLATGPELGAMAEGEAAEYAPLPRRLNRKAARALAQGRRFPDPDKDRALHAEHLRLAARNRKRRRERQRRERQARKQARGNR